MPKQRRTYTIEERRAIVAEIDRRYKAGKGIYRVLAAQLGVTDSDYHYWRRAHPPLPEASRASVTAPAASRPTSAAKASPPPPPYPPAERERLRLEVDRQRATGRSIVDACKAAGISTDSYRKWAAAAAPAPAMRPVEVTALVPAPPSPPALALAPPRPAPAPERLTLVAPSGHRIEGLAVETAAALLRALAC